MLSQVWDKVCIWV